MGDSAEDVLAARAAGIRVVGAMWGTRDRRGLLDARPDEVCETVNELTNLLRSHYGYR